MFRAPCLISFADISLLGFYLEFPEICRPRRELSGVIPPEILIPVAGAIALRVVWHAGRLAAKVAGTSYRLRGERHV